MAVTEGEMKSDLDKTTKLLWIEPSVLAEAEQEFLIYSPNSKSYVFMSKDPSVSHSFNTKLEVHEERLFERNHFKLEKSDGENLYHILNTKTGKYVYVSGQHVLGVEKNPSEHSNKEKFQFLIERQKESRCFTIKNHGKYLYVSDSKAGIPLCHVVEATETVEAVFQFSLEKDVKEAKIQYDVENCKRESKKLKDLKYEFVNDTDEEKPEEVNITEVPERTKNKFHFQYGLEYSGEYLGGTPAVAMKEDQSGTYITLIWENMLKSTDGDDDQHKSKRGMKTTLKLKPKQKCIVKYEFEENYLVIPFTIEVKTRDKKILKGGGLWTGNSSLNTNCRTDAEDL